MNAQTVVLLILSGFLDKVSRLSLRRCPAKPVVSKHSSAVFSVIAWSALVFIAFSVHCPAESLNGPAPALAGPPPSAALSVLRVLGAMALVFGLFFGGLWLWRHWQRLVLTQGRAPKLTVCEAKSLGQRHTLYVIGYEQQRMLVSASPTGVSLLTPLPDDEASDVAQSVPAPVRPAKFGALLLQAITRKP
jgi:flagellar biogenesis protein FliO